MTQPFNLGNLSRLSNAETRSCSAENPTGAKGQGGRHVDPNHGPSRDLGTGWKVRPCVGIKPGETLVLADVDGSGAIQQIWMTPTGNYRYTILRFYWDGETTPSVEVPVGDYFASAYTNFNTFRPIDSLPVCVNPGNAFNCYWEMPFRKHCRITMENIGLEPMTIHYQINYTLTEVPADAAARVQLPPDPAPRNFGFPGGGEDRYPQGPSREKKPPLSSNRGSISWWRSLCRGSTPHGRAVPGSQTSACWNLRISA